MTLAALNQTLHRIGIPAVTVPLWQPLGLGLTKGNVNPMQCLLEHGFTQWTTYPPETRFGRLQAIEGAWLFSLAVFLLDTVVWLLRRGGA